MDIRKEKENTQIIILAGGTGKRMGNPDKPKALIEVAGKTLIDRCIECFAKNGFKDFVLLLGYKHEAIEEHVGDGSKYGIKIKISLDPHVKKVGKAKALKHAIQNGAIDLSKRSIIAYPDDILLDEDLPIKLLKKHLEIRSKKNIMATIVCTSGIEYPYGVALCYDNEIVDEFFEKPCLLVPSSTGMLVVEPDFYKLVEEKIEIESEEAIEIEKAILPKIAKEKKLGRMLIPNNIWIPINTQKELENAEKMLQEKK